MANGSESKHPGLLLIVSGPAGSGKTTLCERLVHEFTPRMQRVVTATSRPSRPGEVDGRDYHFLALEDFQRRIEEGAFYEHAKVHRNFYGVLRSEVIEKLNHGIDLVLNIDVQGAATFRKAAVEDAYLRGRTASVFIRPDSFEELERRLVLRGDAPDDIAQRLETARNEVRQWPHYDYCLRTSDRDTDYSVIRSIYIAEANRSLRLAQAD